jgi:RimJ/RimL family protein N-acetyltransferase
MDPARTGHGLGCQFLQAVVDHGFRQLEHEALRATIASWNQRAVRAARAVGFTPAATFSGPADAEFTIFVLSRR